MHNITVEIAVAVIIGLVIAIVQFSRFRHEMRLRKTGRHRKLI